MEGKLLRNLFIVRLTKESLSYIFTRTIPKIATVVGPLSSNLVVHLSFSLYTKNGTHSKCN